jgi:hypothetical protein
MRNAAPSVANFSGVNGSRIRWPLSRMRKLRGSSRIASVPIGTCAAVTVAGTVADGDAFSEHAWDRGHTGVDGMIGVPESDLEETP